jgi:hypothetical protein
MLYLPHILSTKEVPDAQALAPVKQEHRILTSIGIIITQMSRPTGMFTCATSIAPSAWKNPGRACPSRMPPTMHRATQAVVTAALRRLESSYNDGNRSTRSEWANGGLTSVTSSLSTSAADIPSLSQAHISAPPGASDFDWLTVNASTETTYKYHRVLSSRFKQRW